MFVLFCQFTFCLTKPTYCYYFMSCLVVYGNFPFGRLICRSNGPYFSHDSHIYLLCALCGFGNVCFVLSLCHMSVQPFFTIPLLGKCPMHSVL